MAPIKTLMILATMMAPIMCISVHLDKFHTLIGDRCFNETYDRKPYTLGQRNPVGLSIENLISLIEKIESKLPLMTAQQIVVLLLRRFHIDGLHLTGLVNMQSQIEMKHRRITEEIMGQSVSAGGSGVSVSPLDFPEDALTEDEKCQMFYTLSHTVNETARHDDDPLHTYHKTIHLSRSAPKPSNKTVVVKSPAPIQSEFLTQQNKSVGPAKGQDVRQETAAAAPVVPAEDTDEEVDDRRRRRRRRQVNVPVQGPAHGPVHGPVKGPAKGPVHGPVQGPAKGPIHGPVHGPAALAPPVKVPVKGPVKGINIPVSVNGPSNIRLTRRPREKGVVSFRHDRNMAIAANRVLLGTAVGLLSPPVKSVHQMIKSIANIDIPDSVPDGQLDPLLAVTLSDLLGIDAGSGLIIPAGDVLFGAEGHWNSTACQTSYKLTTNGTLATLAELRGGIDGWNIGRKLPTVLQQNPTISLSQILRQYYSPKGMSLDATVCNRGYGLTELQNKVQREAENYIRVWNGVFYENSYFDHQLTGFVAETSRSFTQFINKAGTERPADERDYCTATSLGTDLNAASLETTADVFFLLDNMPAMGEGFDEEINVVTNVVRRLTLGRNAGSVTVLVNSQMQNDVNLVDDYGNQILTPLYALAYNTTSSQCASCRTAWYDNSQTKINERPLLMELINKTLMEFDAPSDYLPGIPSKNFIWFDYGSLLKIPTEWEAKNRYEDFKWRLRYEHRDVHFIMATLNKEDFKDMLIRDDDWIQMGVGSDTAETKATELVNKIIQTPQVLQYGDCKRRQSANEVYEGYVTPGYKQYWAMYPRHFIKSFGTEFRFKAERSRIRVCWDRAPMAEREDRRCEEATEDGGELKVTLNNPCYRKNFETCPSIHFTIGLSAQSNTAASGGIDCKDVRCRSPDQIKWSVTHSGISCSLGANLLPNWTFQAICLALFLTLFCTNGKRD